MSRAHREERGSVVVLFMVAFLVLLGFVAMVTDTGIMYSNRRLLQNAVDAGERAGVTKLPAAEGCDLTTQPLQLAVGFATLNNIAASELIDCTANADFGVQVTRTYSYNPGDTIIVSARRTIDFGLRYVLGMGDQDVVATARAIIVPVSPVTGIAPFGVYNQTCTQGSLCQPNCQVGADCKLKVGVNDEFNGNFGLMDFACSNSSSDTIRTWISNGYNTSDIPPPNVDPNTGVITWDWNTCKKSGDSTGLLTWGSGANSLGLAQIAYRHTNGLCDNGLACPDLFALDGCTTHVDCPRVVIIPMVENPLASNCPSQCVKVVNFGCFYITGWDLSDPAAGSSVTGQFLNYCSVSSGNPVFGGVIGTPLDGLAAQFLLGYLWQ